MSDQNNVAQRAAWLYQARICGHTIATCREQFCKCVAENAEPDPTAIICAWCDTAIKGGIAPFRKAICPECFELEWLKEIRQ